jgi:hypothetical protein
MNPDRTEQISIKDLTTEDLAHELATSPQMAPYLRLMQAGMNDEDTGPHLEKIAQLPLEERYVWRVASAMKWGFADFDSLTVGIDRDTLSDADLGRLLGLLRHRPIQFCLFLKELLGAEAMERLMLEGIAVAKEDK